MKDKLTLPWAADVAFRRAPTSGEIAGGFPCGPADRELFNELEFLSTSAVAEIINVITSAGLTPDETVLTQLLQALNIRYATTVNSFRSSATYIANGTFVVPAGVTKIKARAWGGGGGGGGAGSTGAAGGGAGGGYAEGTFVVTPGASLAVTVGGAGAAGSSGGGNGGSGGTTSLGSLLSATGGTGGFGTASGYAAGGVTPGVGTGGTIQAPGQAGQRGWAQRDPLNSDGIVYVGGNGGGTFGAGPTHMIFGSSAGWGGWSFGVGGSGAGGGSGSFAGGAGRAGYLIIEY